MFASNENLVQIMMVLDDYRLELGSRRAKAQLSQENGEKGLDNLINIS